MKKEGKHPYKDREYHVVPYDPRWVRQFEQYASKIRKVFGHRVRIEHIGSTSVWGMAGKPCVDVLVVVENLKVLEGRIEDMTAHGFVYAGSFVMENSRLFREMEGNVVLANIHFFPEKHTHVEEMLILRDYLRTHLSEAGAYAKLKIRLYAKYPKDYAAYRKEKDAHMDALKKRASRWCNGTLK